MNRSSCEKCNKALNWCICDLSSYTKIGKVSASQFLDNHTTNNGSVFFQGWAYKHKQMLYETNERDLEIELLKKELANKDDLYLYMDDLLIKSDETHKKEIESLKAKCEKLERCLNEFNVQGYEECDIPFFYCKITPDAIGTQYRVRVSGGEHEEWDCENLLLGIEELKVVLNQRIEQIRGEK